jgi:cytochrome c peroxidase
MQRKMGLAFAMILAGMTAATTAQPQPLSPPPQPLANPTTEAKRVLGKVLFFEEQLSLSNTVSCATCHVSGRGGGDPRLVRNPGPDGIFNTPDDRFGSPGVIHADGANDYVRDALFGLTPQVTSRAANSPINAAYAQDTFWDGRARAQFVDPETGQVAIQNGGGLESQAVNPPLSVGEMAHEGVAWNDVNGKLARVRPLDLATNIPADVATALAGNPGYPELFRRAFGDTQITARRIAFAIAAYERTLISNQSPWDSFAAGVPGGADAEPGPGQGDLPGAVRGVSYAAGVLESDVQEHWAAAATGGPGPTDRDGEPRGPREVQGSLGAERGREGVIHAQRAVHDAAAGD